MPDADWVRYRNLRGKPLPSSALLNHAEYRLDSVLKYDFYAVTGLYTQKPTSPPGPQRLILKIYHTDPWWFPPLAWLGKYLAHRERHYLNRLTGVEGVPQFYATHGQTGLLREYVDGQNLREKFRGRGERVDVHFFPRLEAILANIHARGLAHNDLSKPENILVTPEGAPVIIDLQIALEPGWPRWLGRKIIAYLQSVDRYHIRKLHRRQRPEDLSDAQLAQSRRKDPLVALHSLVRRPYRAVRHFVLNRFFTTHQPHPAPPSPHVELERNQSTVRRNPSSKSTTGS